MIKQVIFLILAPFVCSLHTLNNQAGLAEDFKYSEVSSEKLSTEDETKLKEFLKSMNANDLNKSMIKDAGAYCQSLHSCHECVKSLWYPCNWCHNYGCTHKAESLCPYAAYAFDKPKPSENNFCPTIKHQGHILIAAGVKSNIRVKLQAPDPVIYDKEILCQLKFKEKLLHVKGLILNDVVYCYPLAIDSTGVGETETGTFRLIWGGVDPFSNEIPVIVYRCEKLATDCDTCRMLPQEYQCGWCEVMNSCVIGERCVTDFMKWSLSKMTCQTYGKKLYYV